MGISIGIGIGVQYSGGGVPAWTPADVSTLGWFDASDESTITINASNKVSYWGDKSGNGKHATQATASLQTFYSAADSSISVRDNVNGSTEFLGLPTDIFAGLSQGVVVFAGRQPSGATSGSGGWGRYGNSTITSFTPNNNTYYYDTFLSTARVQGPIAEAGGLGSMIGVKSVQSRHQTGSKLKFFADGLSKGEASATFRNSAAGKSQLLGSSNNYTLFEVIFLASDTDRQKAEGYLAWKWGSESRLPASHPYKNGPPEE